MAYRQQGPAGQGYGSVHSTDQLNTSRDYEPLHHSQAGTPNKEYYPPTNGGGVAPMSAGRGVNPAKRRRSKWLTIGLPLLLLAIIAAAVVGGVVGSRKSSSSTSSAAAANNGNAGTNGAGGSVAGGGGGAGTSTGTTTSQAFALPALDAHGNPQYAAGGTSTAPAQIQTTSALDCGADPWTAPSGQNTGTGTGLTLRPGHPRLIAPGYKWSCLNKLTAGDGYLRAWNDTIFRNATAFYNAPVSTYVYDGGATGSGVLDVARETQLRVKHWAYAYRLSNDSKWATRTYQELVAMSGSDPASSAAQVGTAGDIWNSQHFLDVAEFTTAYALAYDWMFDAWTADQKTAIRGWIVTLGLEKGIAAYGANAFWLKATGNWNCVNTNGLTQGAFAIWDEDTTGTAARMVALTIPNSRANCAMAVSPDGTWLETQDYWYFGITGHAALTATLITATGSDQGMLTNNPDFNKTGTFHIAGTGFVEKFNWGDCGPNKYTATANALLLYGREMKIPLYSLYQRDRLDAPEPFSMLYYDPSVSGNWWYNLPLDNYFGETGDAWGAMRGSWTDTNALWAAMKAGSPEGKQTHSNLDAGDFVLEALGQRWFGELCQENYLNIGYFASEAQNAQRWSYYRCATEGQNTLLIGGANQIVTMTPPTTFGSTNDAQNALSYTPAATSAAYMTADLSSAYTGTVRRGMRLVSGRRAMLLQDEVTTTAAVSWRAHTNATISLSGDAKTATMTLNGQTLLAQITSPATGAFTTAQPVRLASTPALPTGQTDSPNPGITVLTVNIAAGTNTISILFSPQYNGSFSAGSIPAVPLAQWSTTSHN